MKIPQTLKKVEFWTSLITGGIGAAVLLGGINAEQGKTVESNVQVIVGALMSIGISLGYLKQTSTAKMKIFEQSCARANMQLRGYTVPMRGTEGARVATSLVTIKTVAELAKDAGL